MSDARQTLYRHWLMLQTLPREPWSISASDLAQRLADQGVKVSKRSVERDLQALSATFPLCCDESKRPYQWAWMKSAPAFSLPGMSPLQALVLLTAEAHLKGLLPKGQLSQLSPMFDQARQAIENQHSKPGMNAWPQAVAVVEASPPTIPPEIRPGVLETIHDAILEQRVVEVAYRSRSAGSTRDLKLHPIGLLQRSRVGYVACTINDYDDVRLLALHRITKAKLLDTPHRPHTPDRLRQAKALVEAGFADRGKIGLVVRMKAFSAQHLEESPLAKDQKMEPDTKEGFVRISATVHDTDQLRWWLMGYGEIVEVLEPTHLRDWAAEVHAAASALYR